MIVSPYLLGLVFLVVVSEIMLSFKLTNIKSDQDLMKIISKIKHSLGSISDPSNKIIVIRFQEVTNDDSTMIPKLDHKNI